MNPTQFAGALARATTELRGYVDARLETLSRVSVMRRTGETTEVNGYEVPEWTAVYVDLPFRSDPTATGGNPRGVTIGGVVFEDATGVGEMPATATDLMDDDLLEVTAGEWAGDVFRIVAAVRYDQQIARRVPIVEETRPEEWA